ncbi:MAG: hypothetical protein HY332_12035 [Chloroflexi bacterium]|nr:hypothetical protein [Chloroflexota bacterium]
MTAKDVKDLAETRRAYYAANRERILTNRREHYRKNREKLLEYSREYYQDNKDKIRAKSKRWYDENRERKSEYWKQYYRAHREAVLARNRQRYLQRKGCPAAAAADTVDETTNGNVPGAGGTSGAGDQNGGATGSASVN